MPEGDAANSWKDLYLQERASLSEGEAAAYKSFDKLVLWIASGAFAVTAAFLKDIVPLQSTTQRWTAVAACCAFAVAIFGSLLSIWVSGIAFGHCRDDLDEAIRQRGYGREAFEFANKKQSQRWDGKVVRTANGVSVFALLLGLIFLTWFLGANVSHSRTKDGFHAEGRKEVGRQGTEGASAKDHACGTEGTEGSQ